MKLRNYFLFILSLLLAQNLAAQVPQGINYQAIVRDGGIVMVNQTLDVQFTLHDNGTTIYQETHTSATTNSQGLLVLRIGMGTSQGIAFADVDWSTGPYSLRTEINKGTGYVIISDHSLQSVPYALYAERAALPVGNGLAFSGDTLLNTGDTSTLDDIEIGDPAGGDLSGAYPNPQVSGLQNRPISLVTPGNGEVLKWDATSQIWTYAPDLVATGGGAVNTTARLSGDGTATQPLDIAQNGATAGQVLKWDGTAWNPDTDLSNSYNAGTGIAIVGSTLINTGDTDPSNDITSSTTAGGDLSGVYPNPEVVRLRGTQISPIPPSINQVLKFNGVSWVPATDDNTDSDSDPTNELQLLNLSGNLLSLSNGGGSVSLPGATYLQGPGINIVSNIITNTGDLNPNDDVNIGDAAGGDLTGTFPNPSVVAIQGRSVSNVTPASGEILKWNGTQWTSSIDESGPWTESAGTAIYAGDMSLQNGSSQTRVAAGISPNDRGFVYVYDEFNTLKAGIHVDATGMGEVFGDVKNFRIPHPSRPDKEIWYASLEGPEAGAYTRGTATLVNGKAQISFPEHFQLIAQPESMTVMLTPLSGEAKGLAVIEKTAEGFSVVELLQGTGNYSFDWEVKCVRAGHEDYQVIRDRNQ